MMNAAVFDEKSSSDKLLQKDLVAKYLDASRQAKWSTVITLLIQHPDLSNTTSNYFKYTSLHQAAY